MPTGWSSARVRSSTAATARSMLESGARRSCHWTLLPTNLRTALFVKKVFRSLSLEVVLLRPELRQLFVEALKPDPRHHSSFPQFPMQNFKMTIQYDGTHYHGWQM